MVERIVQEKFEFGYPPQLMLHPRSEFFFDFPVLVFDALYHIFFVLRRMTGGLEYT